MNCGSVSSQIRNEIVKNGTGRMYVVNDFARYMNDDLVTRTLSRLERGGVLERISQGIYFYPERNRFGVAYPSLHSIAKKIAQRDKAEILPTGATVLNSLGLSSQVPTNAVYITTGSPRTVNIGGRSIVFKKSAPKNFIYKSEIIQLLVLSMKELGESNITRDMFLRMAAILNNSEEKNLFTDDLSLPPQWIKKILLSIIKGEEYELAKAR